MNSNPPNLHADSSPKRNDKYSRWYSKDSRKKHNKMKVDFLEHQAKMNKFLSKDK